MGLSYLIETGSEIVKIKGPERGVHRGEGKWAH